LKILLILIYTISFVGFPWFFGWLTIGRHSPEPIAIQLAFGLLITIGLLSIVGLFIAGVQGILDL